MSRHLKKVKNIFFYPKRETNRIVEDISKFKR